MNTRLYLYKYKHGNNILTIPLTAVNAHLSLVKDLLIEPLVPLLLSEKTHQWSLVVKFLVFVVVLFYVYLFARQARHHS